MPDVMEAAEELPQRTKKRINAQDFMHSCRSPLDLVIHADEFDKNIELYDGSKILTAPTHAGLHDAIPDVCRVRSAEISMLFLCRDLFFLAANAKLAQLLIPFFCGDSVLLKGLAWILFAITQGTIATGVWVIGHECGHKAFSQYDTLNDVVGYILHTALLVPYFAWKFSHAKHHKYTNHLILGETHVPPSKEEAMENRQIRERLGANGFAVYELILHLLFGWPAYLVMNVTGGKESYQEEPLISPKKGGGPIDHFQSTGSQLFPPSTHLKVRISTAGIVAMLVLLLMWAVVSGWSYPVCYYLGPYIVVNAWLVLYTWLHHGDPDVPHYDKDTFTWFRGALSTVDRNYPWIVDEIHHHIGTTHVVHHFDSRIPHYHAVEATKYAKEYLGPFYRKDPKPLWESIWVAGKFCHYVDGITGIQFLKALRGS